MSGLKTYLQSVLFWSPKVKTPEKASEVGQIIMTRYRAANPKEQERAFSYLLGERIGYLIAKERGRKSKRVKRAQLVEAS